MSGFVGQSLGQYQIVEELARGGMAVVYKAYQPSLDRYVAIKVLPAFFARTPGYLERFHREAKAMARLSHPHVVEVLDYGQQDDTTYLVMMYLNGGSLRDRLGQPLPLETIVRWMEQICSGLAYAHEQGVVHRDIKPGNILFTGEDRLMLSDFGIAKLREASPLTRTGTGMGTPEYMSPEQGVAAKDVDHRSDIYSLGVILYHMATGDVPFRAETPFATLHHHLHTPLPPPETRNPDIAPALTAVIKKALAKQPEQRFQNVQELLDALQAATAAPDYTPAAIVPLEPPTIVDTRTPVPLGKERRRWLWAVVALPLVIFLSLVALVLFRRSHERECELHYNRGITYRNQGDCKLALYEFDEVLTTCAGFQDAAARRTEAEQACNVDDWYDQGREALEVGNWADAGGFLSKVHDLAPDHRQVVSKLFTARVSYAEQLLAEGSLQTALEVFDAALSVNPAAAEVQSRHGTLSLYLQALRDINDQHWPEAIAKLEPLCANPPDFGDSCSELLEGLLGRCDASLREGDPEAAGEAISRALHLQSGDDRVKACATRVHAATPPTVLVWQTAVLKAGPGSRGYDDLGSAEGGTVLDIVGKNSAGTWWQVCCLNGLPGWIADQEVRTDGNMEDVPVVQEVPPTHTPTATPTKTPTPTPTPTPQLLADSWAQFSGKQGKSNWYYMVSTGRNALTFSEMYYDGKKWWRTHTLERDGMRISDGGGHPGEYNDVARVWQSPTEGTILITGRARKEDAEGGDGVVVEIRKNGARLWSQYLRGRDAQGVYFSEETQVVPGDRIYLIIKAYRGTGHDNTEFYATIYRK